MITQSATPQNNGRVATDREVMLDAVTDRGIVRLDPEGNVTHWSLGAQALLGYSDPEVVGQRVSMFHTPEDRGEGVAERELAAARDAGRIESEGWRVCKDGNQFRAGVTVSAVRDEAGSLIGFVKVMRDIAADQQRAHPMFRDMLEAAPDAMIIVGPDGRITFANAQTDRLFGYSREELIGSQVEKILPERFRAQHVGNREGFFAEPVLRPMGGGGLELWALRRDGTEFPCDISLSPLRIEETQYVSAAIRDMTERHNYEQRLRHQQEELLDKQQQLERLARMDTLTGLVNHAETIARLEAALQNRRVPGPELGVLFCDADHFKAVNDTYGHAVGDAVLSTLAGRIRECVRDGDTVGRIGGDEMMVLLPGVHNVDEVVAIAEKIRRRAAEPIYHHGQAVHATVSIGATLAVTGESVATMITRADSGMYEAKQAGRNRVTAI